MTTCGWVGLHGGTLWHMRCLDQREIHMCRWKGNPSQLWTLCYIIFPLAIPNVLIVVVINDIIVLKVLLLLLSNYML